jgi:hypothetical protein
MINKPRTLSDYQIKLIEQAARQLKPPQRGVFLIALAGRLGDRPSNIRPGCRHRGDHSEKDRSTMNPLTIPGLTAAQAAAVEASTKLAPQEAWHDGIIRNIAAALPGGGPPWTDADVNSAISTVITGLGITMPVL